MNSLEAKELLLPIPGKDFIVHQFSDSHGKCCAIGHLVRLKSEDPLDYKQFCGDGWKSEVEEFARHQVGKYIRETHNESGCLARVNNRNTINGYTQDNPKDRVIALLNDMIKDGY
jgi:hypothetical protein